MANKNFLGNNLQSIPNLVTLGNLLCGCLSISATHEGLYLFSILWIILGNILDFADGFLARVLKVESPLGKELDSFSDLISFGIAPSFLIFQISLKEYGSAEGLVGFLPFFSWMIALFSAIRLGRYNLGGDENKTGFTGLPSPLNALLVCSIPLARLYKPDVFIQFMKNPWNVFLFIGFSSILMVLPIQLFNLKFPNFNWSTDRVRIFFIISLIIGAPWVVLFLGIYLLVPFITLSYLLFSYIHRLKKLPL